MDNIITRYCFDKKNVATNEKQGLLQIEVRVKGTNQTTYLSTGVRLYKNQFSDKNGFTCVNHDRARNITLKARDVFYKVEDFAYSDKCRVLQDVKLWNKEEKCTTLVTKFMEEELRKNNPTTATLEHTNSLIRKIADFDKIVVFDDLTLDNIEYFDAYLRKFIKSQPTLYKRHSTLKRYVTKAVRKGLCKYNPYDDFEFKKGKSKEPIFLTEEEIEKIENHTPDMDRLKPIKDLFVFQIFTGLAYTDMMSFDKNSISVVDNIEVIRSNRNKTNESFIIVLLPQAKAVLQKYNYQLPKISNQKYNDYLKLLATSAGINKKISSHTARHTFATYLLNKNIPIETVSRALGHATIAQTQHYAKMLGKKVVDDMSILLQSRQ